MPITAIESRYPPTETLKSNGAETFLARSELKINVLA
jgi:hypothetical protein